MAKAERIPKTNTVRVTSKPRAKLASAISVSHSESDSRGCVFEIPFLIYINKAFLWTYNLKYYYIVYICMKLSL